MKFQTLGYHKGGKGGSLLKYQLAEWVGHGSIHWNTETRSGGPSPELLIPWV